MASEAVERARPSVAPGAIERGNDGDESAARPLRSGAYLRLRLRLRLVVRLRLRLRQAVAQQGVRGGDEERERGDEEDCRGLPRPSAAGRPATTASSMPG